MRAPGPVLYDHVNLRCGVRLRDQLVFLVVFVIRRRMRAFIRGFFGLDWPYVPFTRSPHIYFIVVYLFRSTDDVSLSLIPLVHVVDEEETGYGVGHRF